MLFYMDISCFASQTAKGAKIYSAAVAATADGSQGAKEGDEKVKLHTHSYCCLDYAQIYDVVRYRLHRMKKKLKDELESKNTVQEYICPNCAKRYTAFDAMRLISFEDESFHCESCNGELVAETDKLAAQEVGDGDENARRRRREKLKTQLQKMEEQLKPLMVQLSRVKDLPVPEFGTLQAWEARASAALRAANGDPNGNDSFRSSQGYGGTPMPFLGDTKVEVSLSGLDAKGDIKAEGDAESLKVLPPWMIKEGMKLTREQRGEASAQETKMEGGSGSADFKDDKKSIIGETDDKTNIQDEYLKAYYTALLMRQQEQQQEVGKEEQVSLPDGVSASSSERQVGMKSKRGEDEESDVEWEEDAPATTGNANGTYDLNVQADASGDEEDDVDWEEG